MNTDEYTLALHVRINQLKLLAALQGRGGTRMRQGGNVRQNRTLDKLQAGSCTSGHVDTLSLVLYTLQAVAVSPPTMTVVKPASVAATMFSIFALVPASNLATSKTPIPHDGLVGSAGRSVQLDGLGTNRPTQYTTIKIICVRGARQQTNNGSGHSSAKQQDATTHATQRNNTA